MDEINSLLDAIVETNKIALDTKYRVADQVSNFAKLIEARLIEGKIEDTVHHHLFFESAYPDEYSDDVNGFYKALSWEQHENQGFRIIYSEYHFDTYYEPDMKDNCTTNFVLKKPLLECSADIRVFVAQKGIEGLLKDILLHQEGKLL